MFRANDRRRMDEAGAVKDMEVLEARASAERLFSEGPSTPHKTQDPVERQQIPAAKSVS